MRWFELENLLFESARIQHAEDLIFWEGSAGAIKAIESLKAIEQGQHNDVTVKWDGSPAIIFGRNESGAFILTDKSGFNAKGYDGRSTSGGDLEKMILNRKITKGQEVPDAYAKFAAKMKSIFPYFESAVPDDHVGFFKGDLLYYSTPPITDNTFVFTPNVVTYTVATASPIGKQIGSSRAGVVVHNEIDVDGREKPLGVEVEKFFQGKDLLVMPPITMQKSADIDDNLVRTIKQQINQNKNNIDSLLNKVSLTQQKLSDFPNLLYTYTNSKVDSGMQDLGNDFFDWLSSSKVSQVKQKRLAEYIQKNKNGFDALWAIVDSIQKIKDSIIQQFDSHTMDVQARIGSNSGGEGYVMNRPWGSFKLVNRAGFSAANRAMDR